MNKTLDLSDRTPDAVLASNAMVQFYIEQMGQPKDENACVTFGEWTEDFSIFGGSSNQFCNSLIEWKNPIEVPAEIREWAERTKTLNNGEEAKLSSIVFESAYDDCFKESHIAIEYEFDTKDGKCFAVMGAMYEIEHSKREFYVRGYRNCKKMW